MSLKDYFLLSLFLSAMLVLMTFVQAHHVLGRPSYSLGEDSNTPPSMQVETQIGNYYVTYMAFPAFPQPKQAGRVNLYATRIDNGKSFTGKVTFKVMDDSWFSSTSETLGIQDPDDSVCGGGWQGHVGGLLETLTLQCQFHHIKDGGTFAQDHDKIKIQKI